MSDVIADPAYLAYQFNFATENIDYLKIDDATLRQVPWLRKEAFASLPKLISVPLSEIQGTVSREQQPAFLQPPAFIFHTAYCASTYLSRCLDQPGRTLSLREPQILLDAANAKRLQWRSQTTDLDFRQLPRLFLSLLGKHGSDAEQLVIKPINSVNNIVAELFTAEPQARGVLLYADARRFLLSAIKKGESSRQTIRSMFDLLRCDFPHLANLSISNAIHMSDLMLILTFWRLQMEQAESVLRQSAGNRQLASVYAENLVARPAAGLAAIDEFLQLGFGAEAMQTVAVSDQSKSDAKDPSRPFSAAQRDARNAGLERLFADDIENGFAWLKQNNPNTDLQPELSPAIRF